MTPPEVTFAQAEEGAMEGVAIPEPEQVLRIPRVLGQRRKGQEKSGGEICHYFCSRTPSPWPIIFHRWEENDS